MKNTFKKKINLTISYFTLLFGAFLMFINYDSVYLLNIMIFQVEWKPDSSCFIEEASLCRLGDLTRHGTLDIAGRKANASELTRKLFTETMLSLSGSRALFGKSLVIYDDHGPVARGDRLACSM